MATLKNHPGFELRDDAAEAFDKAEADHGNFIVNSAKRTVAYQQGLIDRYAKGGKYNRPPYLYRPANPPESSDHVKNGGIATDLTDWRRFAAVAEDYGFIHPYPDGDPVHFEYVGGKKPKRSKTTLARQEFLNSIGFTLVEDGIEGDLTHAAYKEYQTVLKGKGWYSGKIDGIWGKGTEAGHKKDVASRKPTPPKPKPSNPFGISDARGLQKISRLYGGHTAIDNDWGAKSADGFTQFLRRNYGYHGNDTLGPVMWTAIARWLRTRWGYKGNDTPGPVMRKSLTKANKANYKQL